MASNEVTTYDVAQVFVTYAGITLTGFAEDSKVTIEYDADAWSKQVGVDGETTRSKSNNRCASVTVKLMQSSADNAALTALYEADMATNAGALPLLIKDSSGTSIHTAESAWIRKLPTTEYAMNAGTREWVLDTGPMVSVIGGN